MNLYPIATPLTHAWKAESTASKCKNILRPVTQAHYIKKLASTNTYELTYPSMLQ